MKIGKHQNNKGYSMVELLIVIAIIGILSALSLITWRSVDSAKYKKSVSTLENELSTLRKATMTQNSSLALRLYYDTTKEAYVIERGYWGNTAGGTTGTRSFHRPEDATDEEAAQVLTSCSYYDYSGVSYPVMIMNRGYIEYWVDGDGNGSIEKKEVIPSVAADDDLNGVVVWYNRSDGSVRKGAGEFRLFRENGELITTVHLEAATGLYHETY